MDNNTKDIIVKFVEMLDKKNLDFKNMQTDNAHKERENENSK